MHAFLPGAGLGTRLRPLTDLIPKPLIPLYHRPLVEFALDACLAAGADRFAINTHHLPEAWQQLFPGPPDPHLHGTNGVAARNSKWRGRPVALFHEPVLLDTGGGVRNVRPWLGDNPVLVHNADVFSTLPLQQLIEAHHAAGTPATLALRSHGPALHVATDDRGTLVTDIRGRLGRAAGTHQFTGIYCASPELLAFLPPEEVVSVIPAFLELARLGRLACVVLDDGAWLDLGTPPALLAAHLDPPVDPQTPRIHPQAQIDPRAEIDASSWIGPGATVAAGATVLRSMVLPNTTVPQGHHADLILGPGLAVEVGS